MSQDRSPRYAAFISYSHADERFARWLHRELERYRLPRNLVGRQTRHGEVPRRLGKFFRDRLDLAATPRLQEEIERAISESAALIVLCSPRAAASPHVNAEIEFFRTLDRRDRIISVILDGEPAESFPPALVAAGEPVAADFRKTKDDRRYGLLKVIAGLCGLDLDELVQRERLAQRRRTLVAVALAGAMTILAAAAAGGGWLAWRQRGEAVAARGLAEERQQEAEAAQRLAEQRRHIADERRREAERARRAEEEEARRRQQAQRLAEQNAREAQAERDRAELSAVRTAEGRANLLGTLADQQEDPTKVALVALEAWNRPGDLLPGDRWVDRYLRLAAAGRNALETGAEARAFADRIPDFRSAAVRALSGTVRSRELWVFGELNRRAALWAIHPGKPLLAAVSEEGRGKVWSLDEPERALDLEPDWPAAPYSLRFSPDGSRLAASTSEGGLRLWSVETGERLDVPSLLQPEADMSDLAFSPDGAAVAVAYQDGKVAVQGLDGSAAVFLEAHEKYVWGVRWLAGGTRLLTHSSDQTLKIWELESGSLVQTFEASGRVSKAEVSSDERYLLAGGLDWGSLWEIESGRKLRDFTRHRADRALSAFAFSPDDRFVLIGGAGGTLKAYEVPTGREDWGTACDGGGIRTLAFSPTGALAASTSEGRICVWRPDERGMAAELLTEDEDFQHLAFVNGGREVAAGSFDGTARLWTLEPIQEPPQLLEGCPQRPEWILYSPQGTHVLGFHPLHAVTCVWSTADHSLVHASEGIAPGETPWIWDTEGERYLARRRGRVVLVGLADGELMSEGRPRGHGAETAIFSERHERILASSKEGAVTVWPSELQGPGVALSRKTGALLQAADTTADDRILATLSANSRVDLWWLQSGEHQLRLEVSRPETVPIALEVEPRGRAVRVAYGDGSVLEWSLQQGPGGLRWDGEPPAEMGAEVRSRGLDLSGAVQIVQNYGEIHVISRSPVHRLYTLSPGVKGQARIAISPDQRQVAELPSLGEPRLWRLPEIVSGAVSPRVLGRLESLELEDFTPAMEALWNAESQHFVAAAAARWMSRCLTPRERRLLHLATDPPCWCAGKSYPTREQWTDSLGRDPFSEPRADGRRCSPEEIEPWRFFPTVPPRPRGQGLP